jgi:hypothetical protein
LLTPRCACLYRGRDDWALNVSYMRCCAEITFPKKAADPKVTRIRESKTLYRRRLPQQTRSSFHGPPPIELYSDRDRIDKTRIDLLPELEMLPNDRCAPISEIKRRPPPEPTGGWSRLHLPNDQNGPL